MKQLRLLNIDIRNIGFQAFLESLESGVVVTPNIDHMMKLQKDRDFYDCYRHAEHVVCDSRLIQLVSKLLYPGKGIEEQIAGSDLFPAFCQYHRNNTDAVKVFLLGGTETSVVAAQRAINERAGTQIVVGAYSPPFGFEHDDAECARIIDRVRGSGATVLAVGVGAPKQEKWIDRHRAELPQVKLFFAIGATIDFQAGAVKRAPRWMVTSGLEWLYRMSQEPSRLVKRYLVDDLPFFWLVLKQRLGLYKNPWE